MPNTCIACSITNQTGNSPTVGMISAAAIVATNQGYTMDSVAFQYGTIINNTFMSMGVVSGVQDPNNTQRYTGSFTGLPTGQYIVRATATWTKNGRTLQVLPTAYDDSQVTVK